MNAIDTLPNGWQLHQAQAQRFAYSAMKVPEQPLAFVGCYDTADGAIAAAHLVEQWLSWIGSQGYTIGFQEPDDRWVKVSQGTWALVRVFMRRVGYYLDKPGAARIWASDLVRGAQTLRYFVAVLEGKNPADALRYATEYSLQHQEAENA